MIQKWVNFECGLRWVQIFSTISHEQSGFMEFHPNHNPPAIHGVWLSFKNLKKASGSIPIKPAITPVIVQATSQFHNLIIVAIQSVSKHLLHDAAPFNTGDHMFDGHTNAGNQAIVFFFGFGQRPALGFFLGLMNRDFRQIVPLKTTIPVQNAAGGKGDLVLVTNFLVVFSAFVNRTQVFDLTVFQPRHHYGFQGMGFFYRCNDSPGRPDWRDG
jgi:hypothetical protein